MALLLNCIKNPVKLLHFHNRLLNYTSPIRIRLCTRGANTNETADELDRPIPFLNSNAAKLQAAEAREPLFKHAPWYQPYVVLASVAVFMLYFCILREENDVDLEFDKTLYERVDGLEEKQLEIVYEYNKMNDIDNRDVEKRLKEIRTENK